jgi:hypothetical protein
MPTIIASPGQTALRLTDARVLNDASVFLLARGARECLHSPSARFSLSEFVRIDPIRGPLLFHSVPSVCSVVNPLFVFTRHLHLVTLSDLSICHKTSTFLRKTAKNSPILSPIVKNCPGLSKTVSDDFAQNGQSFPNTVLITARQMAQSSTVRMTRGVP